ncbi:M1 family aminopeptidase [Mobilicoccus pelagius]|uniref:M1 family aminopeptidase n=1 Tax=Mobilicoccus pelagius TaxID=746032 RepID=UPI00145FBC22|nr:M1 family aminopeptidase [Mobilicoccus pelagius]
MSDSLDAAEGVENVSFSPDRTVCELVFRTWPNSPATARAGTALRVVSITVEGVPLPLRTEAAGAPAGSPGTLVRAPLPRCTRPGERVTAQLWFDLALGGDVDARTGRSTEARAAWFGTAFPLLAWVDGNGWATSPAHPFLGESTTSEVFRLRRLDVTAPQEALVAAAGRFRGTRPGGRPGTTTHRFEAPAVRDVAVTVGDLTLTRFDVDGTRVTLATPRHRNVDIAAWRDQVTTSLRGLVTRFGPTPYPDLWLSVLPGDNSGVEYPGAAQFGDIDPHADAWLVTHELAHQWFYGLVGNDQAAHPWLDEAFATYAQELVAPTSLSRDPQEWLGLDGHVGEGRAFFAKQARPGRTYVATVYRGGARALLQARVADGNPEEFDEAVRTYLHDLAHDLATPEDLARRLSHLTGATRVLREAGALP